MKIETSRTHMWTFVLCSVAGLAVAAPAAAKDIVWVPGANVEFQTTVTAIREVPAGNPLPGLHLDAKVKGRMMDIYVAPMNFIIRYKMEFSKGEEVLVVGILRAAGEDAPGEVDTVLAREITTGQYDKRTGVFRPDLTVYLRNGHGPLWDDAALEVVDIGAYGSK